MPYAQPGFAQLSVVAYLDFSLRNSQAANADAEATVFALDVSGTTQL